MDPAPLDSLPGYRRRFIITPSPYCARSDLEDDYHCMGVTVHHDGSIATRIEAVMARAPWTTCPGAVAELVTTFTGIALNAFAERGAKRRNCTHLHDLAVLAAVHAHDPTPLVYDILVTDPVEGRLSAEIRRDGTPVLSLSEAAGRVVEPAGAAGLSLDALRPWIDSLEPALKEPARLLRWGALIARGRTIPWERQSDASRMRPGSCYTFQPARMTEARRIGAIRDFSRGAGPLADYRPDNPFASAEQIV
jgi:hypothetical protein